KHLPNGLAHDHAVQAERPVFEIANVGFDSLLDIAFGTCLSPESLHLCEASNSWPDDGANLVIIERARKNFIMCRQVGSGSNHTHFAAQHVHELRNLVHAELPHEPARGKHPRVRLQGLSRLLAMLGMHRAVLKNPKWPVLKASAALGKE